MEWEGTLGHSFWLADAGRFRQCGELEMTALILLQGLRENVFTHSSKGLPQHTAQLFGW